MSTEGLFGLGTRVKNASCVPFVILYVVSVLFILSVYFPHKIPVYIPIIGVVVWWIALVGWLLVDMHKYKGDRVIGSLIISCIAPWIFIFMLLAMYYAGVDLHADIIFGPVWVSLFITIASIFVTLLAALIKRRKPKGLQLFDVTC